MELTEARALIALVFVGLYVFARRHRLRTLGERPQPLLIVVFGLSLAMANFTYYLAISLLPVAVAVVVQYSAPAFVVIWKTAVERQRPSRTVVSALLLTLLGVVLVSELYRVTSGTGGDIGPLGLMVAFASALTFATYLLTGERVEPKVGAERAVFYGFGVSSIFWLGVQALRGRPDTLLDSSFLPGIVFLGFVGTIFPFLLFVWGLGKVKASLAGIISTIEPVSAAIIAYLWLGQAFTPLQTIGAASVVAGIAIVQRERPPVQEQLTERAAVE